MGCSGVDTNIQGHPALQAVDIGQLRSAIKGSMQSIYVLGLKIQKTQRSGTGPRAANMPQRSHSCLVLPHVTTAEKNSRPVQHMHLLLLSALALRAAGASLDPLEFALAPPMDVFTAGMPTSDPAVIPVRHAHAAAFFADGTLLYASDDNLHHYAGDLSVRHSSVATRSPTWSRTRTAPLWPRATTPKRS